MILDSQHMSLIQAICGASSQLALVLSPEGVVVYANEIAQSILPADLSKAREPIKFSSLLDAESAAECAALLSRLPTEQLVHWSFRSGKEIYSSSLRFSPEIGCVCVFASPVSQRIQSQNQLDALKSLINKHAIVALTDRRGTILEVNDKFCEVSGYDREELIGQNHRLLNSGYHSSEFFSTMWRTIASGQIWQGEIRNRKKSGHHYWVNTSISPILDECGKVEKYLSIRYDVTTEKAQSHSLQKINKIQRLFIESEFENPREAFQVLLEELLDITESEYGYIGKVLYKDTKPYLKTYAITDISWNEETRLFYQQNVPAGLEFHNLDTLFGYVLKNAEFVIANNPGNDTRKGGLPHGHPPLDAYLGIPIFYGNRLIGSIGIANRKMGYDQELISAIKPYLETCSLMIETLNNQESQKRLQREIETSEKILKATIENSYDGYWDWHIADDYEYLSPKFWEMFGIDHRTKRHHPSEWQELIDKDDLALTLENFEQHVKTRGAHPFNQTVRFRHVNGSTVWIICRGQVIQWADDGSPLRMVGTHTNITEIKEKEEHINRKNEELRVATELAHAASRAKSDFLANMSHEIRTPMNGVIGFTELLKSSGLNEEQMGYTSSIEKSGRTLIELINDILDYSKIESGNLNLSPEPTPLAPLIDEVLEIFSANVQKKPIVLSKHLSATIPDSLLIDGFRLKQVLINLVGNAYKFTASGFVKVTAEYDAASSSLCVQVQDSGIGIDQGNLEFIFNSFQQADLTTTKNYGGTGLGLTICRKLTQLMGGEISCQSTVGVGTTFSFNIHAPAAQPVSKVTSPQEVASTFRSDLNILVVEDNEINSRLCQKFLNKLGYSPLLVSDGATAIELVQKTPIDLILMDIRMPVMDGYMVTEAIRKLTHIRQPRIYALTANAFAEDRHLAERAGMDGFLAKPIRLQDLDLLVGSCSKHAS